ncbi:GNAT family N-acetyltransferase [Kitasatospora sp. NPDC088783]|uniref:GNAT family N-acetyltransferase n=1 Tax=Kitasatospora sp. NPDC088783 TaxID=3364077 RepID=UPI00380CFB44
MTTLTSADLTLRPWEDGDADALAALLADPEIRRRTSHRVSDRAGALRWIAAERAGRATGERLAFAMVTDGRAVGHVVLKRPGGTGPTGEVGYWTGAPARGRGLAPRAVALLSAWALSPADGPALTRLELIHHADNPASCRVARKAGYPLEALLPRPRERHLHALTRPAAG